MCYNLRMAKIPKSLFYILSFTWGAMYTFAGLFVALVMIITGHKPKKWGYGWFFEVGKKSWGGASWGFIFLKDKYDSRRIKNHEFGHAIQNCFFGPFMIPLVTLPSTLRYWFRRLQEKSGHLPKTAYDDIWFENQATRLGTDKIDTLYDD